nr:uncharacterized protein LOC113802712 [Penaeus vannamei]
MDSWRPNPRAPPFVPRRSSLRRMGVGVGGFSNSSAGGLGSYHRHLPLLPRGRRLAKLLQGLLIAVLSGPRSQSNVTFIVEKTRQLREPLVAADTKRKVMEAAHIATREHEHRIGAASKHPRSRAAVLRVTSTRSQSSGVLSAPI